MSAIEVRNPKTSLFALDARFRLWSDDAPTCAILRRGALRFHHHVRSRFLDHDRTIVVYVPPEYSLRSPIRYPVLYMHDGQNLFDPTTAFGGVDWRVDRTIEKLAEKPTFHMPIVVGVYNTKSRLDEFTPTADKWRGIGGKAANYGRFLVEELKPMIDRHYRTIPHRVTTGVAGSSLGGLVSLWLAEQFPNTFGFAAGLSPSLWWDREVLRRMWTQRRPQLLDSRLWIDIGTEEGGPGDEGDVRPALRHARLLVQSLKDHNLAAAGQLSYTEVEGGRHHESAWAARFDQVLEFWLAH